MSRPVWLSALNWNIQWGAAAVSGRALPRSWLLLPLSTTYCHSHYVQEVRQVGMFQPAVHRAIVIVDVESFGDPARTNAHQLAVRDGMYRALRQSFARARMHDLIRRYARDLAAAGPAAGREQALGRLLDYYQHTAAITEVLLTRSSPALPLAPPPAAVPDLPDHVRALAWARAERASLLACLDHATGTGQQARVVALTAAVATLLRLDGPWTDAIARHFGAVQAARHLGDRLGQANGLINLGTVRRLAGDYPGAAQDLEEALGLHRDLGDRRGQANALLYLGAVRLLTGDLPGAAEVLEEALGLYHDLGDRGGEAEALNEAGSLHRVRGDFPAAANCHQQALDLAREFGSSWDEAHALAGLGRCALAAGHAADAEAILRQAREIFRETGAAEASGISAELDALTNAGPQAGPELPPAPSGPGESEHLQLDPAPGLRGQAAAE
jgi:tetratricopeptide (TPR) repeat protein